MTDTKAPDVGAGACCICGSGMQERGVFCDTCQAMTPNERLRFAENRRASTPEATALTGGERIEPVAWLIQYNGKDGWSTHGYHQGASPPYIPDSMSYRSVALYTAPSVPKNVEALAHEAVWQFKAMLSSLAKTPGVNKLDVEYAIARLQDHFGSPVRQVEEAVKRARAALTPTTEESDG